ncbi:MAG: twin-arginine translocase TatA/TatE family subunit [Hymenobacter sp.]
MLHSLFLIGSFGTTEILLIVFVIILLFGAKRIPELFKGMGQACASLKTPPSRKNPPVSRPARCPAGAPLGRPASAAPRAPNFYPGQPTSPPAQPQAPNFYPNDATQPRQ